MEKVPLITYLISAIPNHSLHQLHFISPSRTSLKKKKIQLAMLARNPESFQLCLCFTVTKRQHWRLLPKMPNKHPLIENFTSTAQVSVYAVTVETVEDFLE